MKAESDKILEMPFWKRSTDLLLVLVFTPVIIPVSIMISCWIKLVSPGPVLFAQDRVGVRGKIFRCYKFRSMHVNSDPASHINHLKDLIKSDKPMQKLDSTRDSRLIRCGVLLRSTGLDELPQLVNVVRGEMSIVGPRPCLPYEYEEYEDWQKERCDGTPGMTGLWQVSGKNKTTFNEMIRLDIQYNQTKSLGQDLMIICKTVFVLLGQVKDSVVLRVKNDSQGASGYDRRVKKGFFF